ncbi:hypothetical protein V6N13_040930 [Hibiscus sabdariffa]|uniref:Rad60/SUMO-like domain-containing protein n=1 Tax=Hibiscus sabdariffa TaxID=183260 RepID=A0ABR2R9U8_9ROSI
MSQTGSNGGGASGSGQIISHVDRRERRIIVHMAGQDGTRLTFTIPRKLKLSVLFHNYCRRKQFDYRTARFFHEGLRVLGRYSSAQFQSGDFLASNCQKILFLKLNLEDEAEINCMLHQTGGGSKIKPKTT